MIDKHGISSDPKKTTTVVGMIPPNSVTELRRFMGIINQMNKFPQILHINYLKVSLGIVELQIAVQENAFIQLKQEISSPRVLSLYDIEAKTKVSADASAYGVGAVLMEQQEGTWQPVAIASQALNEAETFYAQIEKEALALTWALE